MAAWLFHIMVIQLFPMLKRTKVESNLEIYLREIGKKKLVLVRKALLVSNPSQAQAREESQDDVLDLQSDDSVHCPLDELIGWFARIRLSVKQLSERTVSASLQYA